MSGHHAPGAPCTLLIKKSEWRDINLRFVSFFSLLCRVSIGKRPVVVRRCRLPATFRFAHPPPTPTTTTWPVLLT